MKADPTVRLDAYAIIARAVEEGVQYGINRAYKYSDEPSREAIEEQVCLAVVGSLCEILSFDDDAEEVPDFRN